VIENSCVLDPYKMRHEGQEVDINNLDVAQLDLVADKA
jgi:hypothetical protein